jgi:glycosyltransferase involved in cell wall biosynthesis
VKISVIIPVKNRASLLIHTLDCILGQSKKAYEIIVVDDASSDNLPQVIEAYQERVSFVKCSGSGPGAARNTGMRIATGDAIQFFDSDDLMTSNKLEVQAKLLEDNKADLVYGPWVKAAYEKGGWKQMDVIMQFYPLNKNRLADFILEGWCNITQSALFRRELLEKVGFWREDIITHEDYEYWFRVGLNTHKFVHENKTCVIYRQHKNQVTDQQVANKSRWMDGIKAMQMIFNNINYRPSLHSLWLFKGRRYLAEMGYVEKFGNDVQLDTNLYKEIFSFYFKLNRKLTTVKGTGWQKMHGVYPISKQFETYIKLLCN